MRDIHVLARQIGLWWAWVVRCARAWHRSMARASSDSSEAHKSATNVIDSLFYDVFASLCLHLFAMATRCSSSRTHRFWLRRRFQFAYFVD